MSDSIDSTLEKEPLGEGAASSLRTLHESVVRDDEIDALGHMNVRFYGARALKSTDRLLAELGVQASDFGAASQVAFDLSLLFTRYHREQHAGSPLVVGGGLVDVQADRLRIYHELRNPDRDELAASFFHDVILRGPGESSPLPIPAGVRKSLAAFCVDVPEEGKPRTIDLDRPPVAPSLDAALADGLAFRKPRVVEEDDCDAEGCLSAELRPFYMWGGDPISSEEKAGPPLIALPNGEQMGWASMETRSVMVEEPRAGMRVQSFAATVEIARKTNLCRYWVIDLDSKQLLLANEVVELALHLGQRRAIEIPANLRARMEAELRADLR